MVKIITQSVPLISTPCDDHVCLLAWRSKDLIRAWEGLQSSLAEICSTNKTEACTEASITQH